MASDDRKAYQAEWRSEWRKRNPEKVAAANRKYREAHLDELAEYHRRMHAENAEERRAVQAVYREANREKIRAQQRAYAAAHPEKRRAARLRRWNLTIEQYDAMLEAQGGGCAICGSEDSGQEGRRFHIDHDHACCPKNKSCGECIRGLLCHHCNTALGGFRDDPSLLAKAIDYLKGDARRG